MTALVWFIILYWVISVGIGLYAARNVKSSKDFAVAGRSLSMPVVTATLFATWFGAEAVLGAPATFIQEGFSGIIADPFGTSMCLVLVGILFARRLYRLDLMTIGDYFRLRYGKTVEMIVAVAIVVSYLGWVAAQIKALGLVFHVISNGALSLEIGMMVGAVGIVVYTLVGGMWSVAVTDFLQMIIIVVGIIYIAWEVSGMAGGAGVVIGHAWEAGKLNLFPDTEAKGMIWFFAAWITMLFGSMPQQDIFQRMSSSRTENIAFYSTIVGGVFYFLFAMLPLFIGYSAMVFDPGLVAEHIDTDAQMILPFLIFKHMPLFAQVMFFGALLSAIASTASATLLAPSVTFSNNFLKKIMPPMSDKGELLMMRLVILVFAATVSWVAFSSESSIFEMVESAYKVTLVAAFIPLLCGFYWKRSTTAGALTSMIVGLVVWIGCEFLCPDGLIPPQIIGFGFAIAGMIVGTYLSPPPTSLPEPPAAAGQNGEQASEKAPTAP